MAIGLVTLNPKCAHTLEAVSFHEADLVKIYEEEAIARAEEVKAEFRKMV
jgi:hypothetical protein